jgi:hypothetical protein
VGHNTCTSAAVDLASWIVNLQAVSMEWIRSANCVTGDILLGWHSMGRNSGYSLRFLEIYEKRISYCIIHFVVSAGKVAMC